MRLLKWLFQPAYLVVVIVLVALYVNREAIFPEKIAESLEAEALVAKVDALVEQLRPEDEVAVASEAEAPAPQKDEVALSLASNDVADTQESNAFSAAEADSAPADELSAAPESITEAATAADSDVVEDAAGQADVPSLPSDTTTAMLAGAMVTDEPVTAGEVVDDAVAMADTAELAAVPEVADAVAMPEVADAVDMPEVADAVDVPGEASTPAPVAPAPETSMSPLVIWRAARTAVWQGDLNRAVASYQQLIAVQPGNYDAYGEMGNVLLAQSNVAAAIEAYVTAARLIRQSGNLQMAYRLAAVVATLDEQQGQALYDEFSR